MAGSALTTALATGDRAEIDKRLAALSDDGSAHEQVNKAMAGLLDNPAAAPDEIRRLAATEGTQGLLALNVLAHWAAYYGDPELAFTLLRRTAPNDLPASLIYAIWRPVMRDMRKLPAFKDFVKEIGLVDYWREFGWPDRCRVIAAANGGDDDFEFI